MCGLWQTRSHNQKLAPSLPPRDLPTRPAKKWRGDFFPADTLTPTPIGEHAWTSRPRVLQRLRLEYAGHRADGVRLAFTLLSPPFGQVRRGLNRDNERKIKKEKKPIDFRLN